MENILITGMLGFIASNLTNYLVKKYPQYNFYGLDCKDYCAKTENIDVWDYPNFKFLYGNITNIDCVSFYLKEYKIDTILHLAAISSVDLSYSGNSLSFTFNNTYGSHVIFECARRHGIEKIIHMSTDEVCTPLDDKIIEDHNIYVATNIYSGSKAGAEMILRAYGYSYSFPFIVIRSNNVMGPRQYTDKAIPKFICNLLTDRKIQIHGKGLAKRSFVYVDDACKAIEQILFHGKIGETYNISSNDEFSVLELAHKIISTMKPELSLEEHDKLIEYTKDRGFNDPRYLVNSDSLKQLGWKQEVSFDEGLKRTIEWYINNLELYEDYK